MPKFNEFFGVCFKHSPWAVLKKLFSNCQVDDDADDKEFSKQTECRDTYWRNKSVQQKRGKNQCGPFDSIKKKRKQVCFIITAKSVKCSCAAQHTFHVQRGAVVDCNYNQILEFSINFIFYFVFLFVVLIPLYLTLHRWWFTNDFKNIPLCTKHLKALWLLTFV